jgi:hypothetical protein
MTGTALPRAVPVRTRSSRAARHRFTRPHWSLAVGLVATVPAWPQRDVPVVDALDTSWQYLITHAAGRGVSFGSGLVFTYGPLGWIFTPVGPSGAQLWVATLAVLAIWVAGFAALARLCARSLGRVGGGLVALAVAAAASVSVPEMAAALGILVVLDRMLADRISTARKPPGARAVAVLGLVAGLALTSKTGVGELFVGVTAIWAVAVAAGAVGWVRRLLVLLAAAGGVVVGFGIAWLGTGQRLGDVPAFARGSTQIQTGYQWAMVYDQFGRGWEWYPVGAGFALLIAAAVLAVRAAPPGRRLWTGAAAVVALGATYYLLLQAFVFHAGNHDIAGQTTAAIVVLGWVSGSRPRRGWAGGVAVLAAVVLVGTAVASSAPSVPAGAFEGRATALGHDVRMLAQPARRRAEIATDIAATARTAAIPAELRAAIGTGTVVPIPWDITGPIASGLDVRTLPVPQTYSAYTPYLDQLNARALLAPDRPEFALRQYKLAIDHRNPMWESPLAMLALLCHYRQVTAQTPYQLLERSGPRCRVSTAVLETVTVRPGQTVVVPRPAVATSGVVMSLGLADPLSDRIARRLGREPPGHEDDVRMVGPDPAPGVAAVPVSYRLVPQNAGEPIVVDVPPGLWASGTTGSARAVSLSITAQGPVRITFRELVRTDLPAGD